VGKLIVNKLLCVWLLSGCAVMASKEAVVFCQAADTVTTLHATSLGARELNPFVGWLLETTGPGGFIAAKIAVTLLVVRVHPEMSADLVRLLNGVTCAVAAHNAHVAAKLEDLGRRPEQPEVAK
jgi:hypothetical protein